jgi:molybdopterin converting factor subunit 1
LSATDEVDIQVLFFAAARDIASSPELSLRVPRAATLADIRRSIGEREPRLIPLLSRCRLALDQEFVDETSVVRPGSEIAVLPPVSGG